MIKLRVISFDNKPVDPPVSAIFGEKGGTVGRGADNQLVLHDPKNVISRTQAFVRSNDARHSITNLSQANPLILNGVEIAYQQEYPIRPTDVLQIGLVRLVVESVLAQADVLPGEQRTDKADVEAVAMAPGVSRQSDHGAASLAANSNVALSSMPEPFRLGSDSVSAATSQPDMAGPVAGDVGHKALAQAFLRGAGIADNSVSIDINAEFMEMVGKMLALSIQGAVDQTKLRSLVKREVNADVTMVVVRGNNPIKFLEDGTTVLTQMLRKKMPGFMAPVEAMQDACEDLYAHQLAVVAGMRAMVADILARLDPQAEDEQQATSLFGNLLQAKRNARQLEAFATRYHDLCREYSGDDAPMFGKAFLDAYEREAEQVRGESDRGG